MHRASSLLAAAASLQALACSGTPAPTPTGPVTCAPTPLTAALQPLTAGNVDDIRVVALLCDPDSEGMVNTVLPYDGGVLATRTDGPVTHYRFSGDRTALASSPPTSRGLAIEQGVILAGTDEGGVVAWDAATTAHRWTQQGTLDRLPVWGIDLVAGTVLRGGADKKFRLLSPDGEMQRELMAETVFALDADTSSQRVLLGSSTMMPPTGQVLEFDLTTQTFQYWGEPYNAPIFGVAWRPQTTQAAIAVGSRVWIHDEHGREPRFEVDKRKVGDTEGGSTMRAVRWSPSGDLLFAAAFTSELIVAGPDGRELRRIDARQQRIQSVAVAPDATWVATGGDNGIIQVWGVPR